MEWLTKLSSSPVPNAIALVAVTALAVTAFLMRQRPAGVGFGLIAVAVGATIGAKNAAYNAIVSNPHHENNLAARHDFAQVLLCVSIAEIVLAVIVGIIAASAQRLRWMATFAVIACAFAAVSMLGWRSAYLHQDMNRPVHYVLGAPWASGSLLLGLAVTAVGALVSLVRRPRPRH